MKNIILTDTGEVIGYTSPQTGRGEFKFPRRSRVEHGNNLKRKIEIAWEENEEAGRTVGAISVSTREGMYLEFLSSPGNDLKIKSLENMQAGVRLLNVREEGEGDSKIIRATVYIPPGKESYFAKKVSEYLESDTASGKPKNAELINSIEDIQLAILEAFWIGNNTEIPDMVPKWCEAWIRIPLNLPEEDPYEVVKKEFVNQCKLLSIECKDEMIKFPERAVMLIKANKIQLQGLISLSQYISEFRIAAEVSQFFTELSNSEQNHWVEDLLNRMEVNSDSNTFLCILDTGLNNGHRLIAPVSSDSDLHSYKSDWGRSDHSGHGTEMAGIATFFNLEQVLSTNDEIQIPHKIESVKILPPKGQNDPNLYGYITGQATSIVEIERPNANRVLCMAVTARGHNTKDGSPSSWSAAIDAISSGYEDDTKRLIILSAGNVQLTEISERGYPLSSELHAIENPGQSWNAITVGAFTEKVLITDEQLDGYSPVAEAGDLSPFSSTSTFWDRKWPIKPEIVCEGGNLACLDGDYTNCDDLSLLTTHFRPVIKNFTTINATSAATAQASWIAAQLMNEYPNLWPETIRGLIIHSAEWTERMRSRFLGTGLKKEYYNLLRNCGYGVPNLDRALRCAKNSVNLIIEDELQPYHKVKSDYKTKDMHLHELPWPKEVLLGLGEIDVSLRVTLSYFIDPSPGEIGWKDRYRYASCGLRFDVNNVNESTEEFKQRINKQMRDEDYSGGDSGSDRWKIGSDNRHLGSIHSDIWSGTAAQLCESNLISIYPTIGWWRERPQLRSWNKKIRYSLIISLSTPDTSIDLYAAIMEKVRTKIDSKTQVDIKITV